MDIPTTTKVTYEKRKEGKTFTEYKPNETGNYPELIRVSEYKGENYLSIKKCNKWVQYLMRTTEHFDFYGVSLPFRGTEIILVVHYTPSVPMIELRVWEDVSVARGNMAELNEAINQIIYHF